MSSFIGQFVYLFGGDEVNGLDGGDRYFGQVRVSLRVYKKIWFNIQVIIYQILLYRKNFNNFLIIFSIFRTGYNKKDDNIHNIDALKSNGRTNEH